MAGTRRAASVGTETATQPPAQAPAPPEPQIASGAVAFPTVGRIVQVRIEGGEIEVDWDWRAGIVIASDSSGEIAFVQVGLLPDDIPFPSQSRLYRTEGVTYYRLKPENHGGDIGCWRWPPRV